MRAYVERHTTADGAPVFRAWTFDLGRWGTVGCGDDVAAAAADLRRWTGAPDVQVVEEIGGTDPAFARDLEAATPGERAVTVTIVRAARRRTLELLSGTEDWKLDRPVSDAAEAGEVLRVLGLEVLSARDVLEWLVLRETVEDPVAIGAIVPDPPATEEFEPGEPVPLPPLAFRLGDAHERMLELLRTLPPRIIRATPDGAEWSTVKLLRTLAWRERSLIHLLERLLG